MINFKEIEFIYLLEWEKTHKLNKKELETIKDNINENMAQLISDEIRDYLENKE